MEELLRRLRKELYKKSCYEFVKEFWDCADPSKFIDGKLVQFYCETFQYMSRHWVKYEEVNVELPELTDDINIIDVREDKRKININVPPRHSKSMIFNVLGPVWLWINDPIKAASVSHTTGLAGEMNSKRIKVLNSDKFKYYFGDEVWLESNSRGKLVDTRGGELYSIARESFTGHGADIIINDDLTNAETARRDREEMASAWSYYQNTMPSRVNDIDKCIIMNIQQRLAPNDITGHILADPALASLYIFVVLPAIFKKKTYVVCPISGDVFIFNEGDTLWPERFGDYSSLRIEVGETVFETQYLQNPIASDKTIIKENMIVEKDACDVPNIEMADIVYASHDFPVKDKDTSDYLGSVLGYRVGGTLYITDCLEKRMAFVKSVAYVTHIDEVYPGSIQVIEDKANGSPILQQLQDVVPGMQAYQTGTASKTQRLESASLYMTSGNVVFVRTVYNKFTSTYHLSESLKNLKTRLLNFPFVEHDDITDAFSMLVLFVFMDKRYMVYGRSFSQENIIDSDYYSDLTYKTIFFNKEGNSWKVVEIAVRYGEETKICITREARFKGSMAEGLAHLKEFAPGVSLFIDCSATEALAGLVNKGVIVERYECEDFDKSVAQTNLGFSSNRILIDKHCVLTIADIESFKYSKTKSENVKYFTTKDGFVACIRTALKYYGGIV